MASRKGCGLAGIGVVERQFFTVFYVAKRKHGCQWNEASIHAHWYYNQVRLAGVIWKRTRAGGRDSMRSELSRASGGSVQIDEQTDETGYVSSICRVNHSLERLPLTRSFSQDQDVVAGLHFLSLGPAELGFARTDDLAIVAAYKSATEQRLLGEESKSTVGCGADCEMHLNTLLRQSCSTATL